MAFGPHSEEIMSKVWMPMINSKLCISYHPLLSGFKIHYEPRDN